MNSTEASGAFSDVTVGRAPPPESYRGTFDRRRSDAKTSWYFGQSNECAAMRAMARFILGDAKKYRWTVQGFGMLRTYIPASENNKRFRFNVWDSRLAVPGVNIMHDHPWDFDSWIINGKFRNVRYVEDHYNGDDFKFMTIKCGEDGCAMSEPSKVRLRALPVEHYKTGDKYHQDAREIHASFYDEGTVTLNDRVGDTEHAKVFWLDEPQGYWVDAKPREATPAEVAGTINLALEKWE
jgi:hypothetical protein